jgi:hypothetical protein
MKTRKPPIADAAPPASRGGQRPYLYCRYGIPDLLLLLELYGITREEFDELWRIRCEEGREAALKAEAAIRRAKQRG